MTEGDLCDVKDCGKIAFDEVAVRKNYWFGEKIVKIDVCSKHQRAILKAIGFEDEFSAKRAYGNKWRKTD